MGWMIVHDERRNWVVLYDTTTERALACSGFIGDDCFEEAEDFVDWLGDDPLRVDNLDQMIDLWRAEAFNEADEFVGHKSGEGRVHA